jgi:hypothetical protein
MVDIYSHVFPLTAGPERFENGVYRTIITQVAGTAFSIGRGIFLTAAHVAHNTSEHQRRLGYVDKDKNLIGVLVQDAEVLDGLDIALLRVPELPAAPPFRWASHDLARLEQVFAAGYPFALDNEAMVVSARAFIGHVSGVRTFSKLALAPQVYELTFQCARGLSGAPLCIWGKRPDVAGVVIGNQSTEMNVFTDREEIVEGTTTIVQRYEAMQLGVAVSSTAILALHSKLLGTTIGAHLSAQGLVA